MVYFIFHFLDVVFLYVLFSSSEAFLMIFRTRNTFVEKIKADTPMNLIHPLGRKEVEKGGIDLGSKVFSLSLFLLVSST